jgi:hypothetical protein
MEGAEIKTRFARRALTAACALVISCGLLLAGAGGVGAERTAAGDLVVSLAGTLSPRLLPRAQPAPISLDLSSDFSTSDGTPLPSLRRIEIALGNRGRLQDRGLPACRPRLIRATTFAAARAACGAARVGYGHLAGYLDLAAGEKVDFEAALLAFNSRPRGGGRAILADVHSAKPPMSFLMKFVLHRSPHSIHLVAVLPAQISRWVRVTHFDLGLHRVYTHAGRTYSYLSAVCSLPRKLTGIVFPLATVTYGFTTREVSVTTVRACRARG